MTQENKDKNDDTPKETVTKKPTDVKKDTGESAPKKETTETPSETQENNEEKSASEIQNELAAKLDALKIRVHVEEDEDDDPFDNFFNDEDDDAYAHLSDDEYDEKLDGIIAERETVLEQLSEKHAVNVDLSKSIFALRKDIDQVKNSVNEHKQEQVNALGQDLSAIIDTLNNLRPSDEATDKDPDLQSTRQGMDMIVTSLSTTFNKHGVTTEEVENKITEPSEMIEDHAETSPIDIHVNDELDTIEEAEESLSKITEKLNKEIKKTDKLNKQLDNAKGSLERAEKQTSSKKDVVLEKFAKDLIGVADTLARAVEATPDETIASNADVKKIMDGMDETGEILSSTFNKYGIEKVNSDGAVFDPTLHEAVTNIADPTKENNTVGVVMQNGYTLNGKLIRAARVGVVKNP